MKIIKPGDHPIDRYINELDILDRTPGIDERYYLRISASAPGYPWEKLSNEYPGVDQLNKLFEKYKCKLDVEVFIRELDGKSESKTLKLSYPSS